ncbi:hypothetical protein [Ferruginibacter albus]|uniref:hypothetical protein n=1 Tax=Ferruginibacter albus TaxID=2875540 RepID=UPI001CC5C36A|nr:hypothetical protein [Ferruginibacter albus]UAY52264.1 hypothetical protein K9M53_00885 [Ferruginibacter albus]
MSNADNFDEHIRSEFSDFNPQVPRHIWDNIVAERERRKPAGFWFNLFNNKAGMWAGLIAAGVVGILLLAKNNNTSITDELNEQKTITTQPINNNAGLKDNNATNAVVGVKEKTNTTITASKDLVAAEKNPSFKRSRSNTLVHSGNSEYNINKANNNSNAIAKANKDNNITEGLPSQQNTLSFYKRSKGKFSSFKSRTNSVINNGSEEDVNDIAEDNISTSTTFNFLALSQYSPSTVEKNSLVMNDNLSLKKKPTPDINLPECPTIEKDAAGNKRYFEVYLGPDYGVRTLSDTANSVYLQKREETSRFTYGYSAGVRYTKVFSNGMSVRAALNYSQINEKFTFIQGNIVQVTYTIDPNTGDTTGSYTVTGSRYKTTYNAYRSIDIPLTIGYELGNGKIHANINAGIVANIYSWQRGDILDTNFKPVDITTGKGSTFYQFKTNVGLGVTGGASIYYKINEQLHFLAEPYVRYNFQPMGTNNLSLQQKYTTIGLRLGLRFDIP